MYIFIVFLLLEIFKFNSIICFDMNDRSIEDSSDDQISSRPLWSRLKSINPPSTSINRVHNLKKFIPKYIFKGPKERISSDLDDGFMNNESPLNLWSSGNISYDGHHHNGDDDKFINSDVKNHKIDDKSLWNITELLIEDIDDDRNNSSEVNSGGSDNNGEESEIILNNSNNTDEFNSYDNSNDSTKAVILSKQSEFGQNFPIYFTNPATGIVYAIHPVATSSQSVSVASSVSSLNHPHPHPNLHPHPHHHHHPYTIENYTSQMYVTKEEYERKIQILKERFQQQCNELRRKLQEQNRKFKTTININDDNNNNNKNITTTIKKPSLEDNNKKKIVKYKDPLIVEALDGVLGDVYDQIVDTVTTKVVKKNKKKKKKNEFTRNKMKKRKKITNNAPTIATAEHPIDGSIIDEEESQERKPPESLQPSTLSPTSTIQGVEQNNYYDYNDDKRYTLISYNGGNGKLLNSKPIINTRSQNPFKDNENYKNLVPVHLTPATSISSSSKVKRMKRSIEAQNPNIAKNSITSNYMNETEKFNKLLNGQKNLSIIHNSKEMNHQIKIIPTTTPTPKYQIHNDGYYDFDDLISDEDLNDPGSKSKNKNSIKGSSLNKRLLLNKNRKLGKSSDDDYAYLDDPGIFSYIEDFMYTIQNTVSSFLPDATEFSALEEALSNTKIPKLKLPKLTSSNKENQDKNDNENNESNGDDDGNTGVGSWFTSWFGSDDTESAESQTSEITAEEPGWFDSIFGTEEKASDVSSNEAEDDGGLFPEWLFGWFDSTTETKKKKSKLKSTITATTTSKPISNIDPQKWIGMLAQHLVNSTPATISENLSDPSYNENESARKVSYDKYQIWRLKLHKESQLRALERYKINGEGSKINWLIGPSLRGLTDVAVPPKLLSNFQAFLKSELIEHEVLMFDFGKAILYEESKERLTPKPKRSNILTWQKYHTYDEIIRFLELNQVKNQNFVELLHIGRSYEGRPLIVAKISYRNGNHTKIKKKKTGNRSGILIEAGIHGREWIGPASATWIINEIVKVMKSNETSSQIEAIKKANWYVIPVLNPDGYTYSQEYDRLWKKSRSKNIVRTDGLLSTAMNYWFQQEKPHKFCYGVDLDRNWDYEWSQGGSSKAACNEFFAGYSAFSEPETKAFSKFLLEYRKEIKVFISFHSYGQIVSYPNKVRKSYIAQKLDELLDVAMVGIDGLRKSGSKTRYKIDSTNDMTPSKSGSSDNFALNVAGIPYSYTFHIGDKGIHGFLLPSSYIETTSKDVFEIIKAILDYIL